MNTHVIASHLLNATKTHPSDCSALADCCDNCGVCRSNASNDVTIAKLLIRYLQDAHLSCSARIGEKGERQVCESKTTGIVSHVLPTDGQESSEGKNRQSARFSCSLPLLPRNQIGERFRIRASIRFSSLVVFIASDRANFSKRSLHQDMSSTSDRMTKFTAQQRKSSTIPTTAIIHTRPLDAFRSARRAQRPIRHQMQVRTNLAHHPRNAEFFPSVVHQRQTTAAFRYVALLHTCRATLPLFI